MADDFPLALDEASRAALDWPELLARLAGEAESDAGRAACRELPLAGDAAEARRRMAAVAELAGVLRAGEHLPSLALPVVEPLLASAEKGMALGPEEVRPIAALCAAAEGVRRFFRAEGRPSGRPPTPEVDAVADTVDAQTHLAAVLRDTFDAAGEIRDAVSPELARLRREREHLQGRARLAIEELMRVDEYASVLQDTFFTIRSERYVLPLKASAKSMGLGIVHDTSRTGETVFVEPTALVTVNNRLKVAELEIKRESRRILEELTARVADAAPALRATAAALAVLDVWAAAARLGLAYDGALVEIVSEPVVDLRRARHPLLTLRAGRATPYAIVANDVALGGAAARLLVVSGPNAGGKTVLLKTVGLAALMARAGLLVPAAGGSRLGFFDSVLADIGDKQSVMGDLSTFSAHLANVGAILRRTDAGSGALVLFDELMAGTNPDQGAALARATAEALAERAVVAVITTHYDSLKALAESDPRFANAGMEYDLEHLRPTFRLAVGTPGRSYALDIAARMGLPEPLLARARALAGASSVGLEAVIAELAAREAELAHETRQLADARTALASTEEEQRAATSALAARERELARHTREAIEAAVREAREGLRAIVRDAQKAGSARAAEAARAAVAEAAREALGRVPATAPAASAAPPAALAPGTRVFVPSLNAQGVVAAGPAGRGRVKVTVGAMSVEVDASDLEEGQGKGKDRGGSGKARAAGAAAATSAGATSAPEDPLALATPSGGNTLDLRGTRADDALGAVESYLDRAALDGRSPVFLIHGHGTGALRKLVRAYLDRSPYVGRWAPGGPRQGGDGVSVVELR